MWDRQLEVSLCTLCNSYMVDELLLASPTKYRLYRILQLTCVHSYPLDGLARVQL